MYDTEQRQAAKVKLERLATPLIEAVRAAGFTFSYHVNNSDFGARNYIWGEIKHPDHQPWSARLHIENHTNSQTVDKVSLTASPLRGLNWRNWSSALKNVVPKLQESLALSKQSYAAMEVEQTRINEWDVRREKDFEGWEVPAFLDYGEGKAYRLWGLRRDSTQPQMGRYSLDMGGTFRNLSAGQVKALCTFIQDQLPKIP